MQILYGKEYQRKSLNPLAWGFQPEDSQRCVNAVEKFLVNPHRPGLNFERLGSGRVGNRITAPSGRHGSFE